MSKLRKKIIPQLFQIVIVLLVFAVTADDFTFQAPTLNVKPVLQQIMNNDDPGDGERHPLKVSRTLSGNDYEWQLSSFIIRNYLKNLNEELLPVPPAVCFQPDRAPPV